MGDAVGIASAVGGGLAAFVCLIAAFVNFSNDKPGAGVGLLILSPIVFFIGGAVVALVIVAAVIAFAVWAITSY